MKKILAIALAVAMVLCLGVSALAADTYTVTLINGMDGSVHATYEVAAGEDFVFSISCAAPCDMGPIAEGDAGSGVTTTVGTITYSNITTGGPNAYPTAETVTISGINADATVTVTPNPAEVDALFPTITEGELAGGASGEASGEASGNPPAMREEAVNPVGYTPDFAGYKQYALTAVAELEAQSGLDLAAFKSEIEAAADETAAVFANMQSQNTIVAYADFVAAN